MNKLFGLVGVLAASVLAVGAAGTAGAQSDAGQTITLIVPYPPGGGIDPAARVYAEALSEQLGQKIVVQNQGGASGQIGTARAARSAPDGNTLLFGSVAPNVILPAAYGSKLPYDAQKDFAPIGLIAEANYVLLVSTAVKVESLQDLIEHGKQARDPITYASSGTLGGPHLAGALLGQKSGLNLTHVPYRGNGPALTALMGGEVTMMFDSAGGVAARGESDKYRVIAVSGNQPYKASGPVPNLGEVYPGHNVSQWYGLLAIAGTPPQVLQRLETAHHKAVNSPALQRRFRDMGLDVITDSGSAKFKQYIDSEIARWNDILTTAKIEVPPL